MVVVNVKYQAPPDHITKSDSHIDGILRTVRSPALVLVMIVKNCEGRAEARTEIVRQKKASAPGLANRDVLCIGGLKSIARNPAKCMIAAHVIQRTCKIRAARDSLVLERSD